MRWIVQTNLGSDEYHQELKRVCDKLGHEFVPIKAVPFSDELPDVSNDKPAIFYGATNLVTQVSRSNRWSPGVFFDEEKSCFTAWRKNLPYEYLLNYISYVLPIRNIPSFKEYKDLDRDIFVRPNKDLKEFSGEVMPLKDLVKWARTIMEGKTLISPDSEVVLGSAYNIQTEWRLFVSKKKVIAASQYKDKGKLNQKEGAPKKVIDLAEKIANIWTPHNSTVMDLCSCGDEIFLLEFNCMNSSGFYHCNIEDIVRILSEEYKNI